MNIQQIKTVFPTLTDSLVNLVNSRLTAFYESLENSGLKMDIEPHVQADLIRVLLYSEYVSSALARYPDLFQSLVESGDLFVSYDADTYAARLGKQVADSMTPEDVKPVLLKSKLYENIRIAWRDLTGAAGLEETLQDLSNLACAVVDTAIQVIYATEGRSFGLPEDNDQTVQGLIVLGMGKLGARELNFSSDIDLMFVYSRAGYTTGENAISNEEFFTRVCRRFVKFFAAGLQDMSLYRVDVRLRPYGEGGPLVMSAAAFEDYYQAQGREWERYAMIKARPVAGDIAAGIKLLERLKPFVYRRYFDYGSFDSFREMKHRISLQVKSKKLKNNIKLGAGGIREIEFFGQLFQLIRGGVEPRLQEQQILKVLDLLVVYQCIDAATRDDLKHAYRFLRMVENRLQAHADLQTHDIPENAGRREILALSMGEDSWPEFESALNAQMETVHFHFNQLLVSGDPESLDSETRDLKELWTNINDPQFTADPRAIGKFTHPEKVLDILRSLEEHPNTRRLSSNGRKKLALLIPVLVKKISEQADEPETLLMKLVDLVTAIERRTCYLSLLIENKKALETLITLARKSPWIINFLSRHPALLDELIHPASLYAPPDRAALKHQMEIRISGLASDDLEMLLEELCIFRQINMLRVAAADVSGNYPLMKVSDHLTYIAETILSQVLDIAWHIVAGKYGTPFGTPWQGASECGFAIVAYGKVGGLEMGYKSDIDIVFLYQADSGMTQGAGKPIENIRFYSNLGQRIINALTVHTSAGMLYGADMRLRPGGSSGPLVSHIDAFEAYLADDAWTWEHQALIRARCVAGDLKVCDRFEKIRKIILTQKRDPAVLRKEVSDMRERMRQEHLKAEPGFFDVKHARGGILDIEFLVQYLILKHAHDCPDLVIWTDNIRLLESLDAEGIITGCQSEQLQNAYLVLRKIIHRHNLQEKPLQVSETAFAGIRRQVIDIYDHFFIDQEISTRESQGQ